MWSTRHWRTEVRIKQLVARGEARCWRQVAVVQDGHDLPIGYTTYLFVSDDDYKVTVNGWTFQTGRAQRVNDRESDVIPADGPQAGQSIPQITQIEGDVLTACAGPPGGERPTEFTSQPGSGRTLSVWLRVA